MFKPIDFYEVKNYNKTWNLSCMWWTWNLQYFSCKTLPMCYHLLWRGSSWRRILSKRKNSRDRRSCIYVRPHRRSFLFPSSSFSSFRLMQNTRGTNRDLSTIARNLIYLQRLFTVMGIFMFRFTLLKISHQVYFPKYPIITITKGTELFFDYDGSNVLAKKFDWILSTQEVPQNDFVTEVQNKSQTI